MSWFSLIYAEKSVLESHQFFKSVLTGEFIGQYAVDEILKKNKEYLRTKEAVSSFFTDKLSNPLDSFSKIASEKLLEKIMLGKKIPQLFPELFSRFPEIGLQISTHDSSPQFLEKKEESSMSGMHHLIYQLLDKFIHKEKKLLDNWRHALEDKEEELEIFVKKTLAACLMPLCKTAMKAGFHTILKACIGNFFDSLWKTGISIAGATIIYRVALGVFGFATAIWKDLPLYGTFSSIKNNLPSATTALWILTAIHAAEMIKIFWKVEHLNLTNTELNKSQVKKLVVNLTEAPIHIVLKDVKIYRILHLAFKQEKIDDLITLLIHEAIDHYWNDLHAIRFLNLPLVT